MYPLTQIIRSCAIPISRYFHSFLNVTIVSNVRTYKRQQMLTRFSLAAPTFPYISTGSPMPKEGTTKSSTRRQRPGVYLLRTGHEDAPHRGRPYKSAESLFRPPSEEPSPLTPTPSSSTQFFYIQSASQATNLPHNYSQGPPEDSPYFLATDIFRTAPTVDEQGTERPDSPCAHEAETTDDTLDDDNGIEEPLDNTEIESQLVSTLLDVRLQCSDRRSFYPLPTLQEPPENAAEYDTEDIQDENSLPEGINHLKGCYLPYLLGAKAPAAVDVQCSSSTCQNIVDLKRSDVQLWRCVDCFGQPVYCASCMRDTHRKLPFHRIESWQHGASIESIITENFLPGAPTNFGFFRRSSLYNIGLQVGLGHDGDICPRTSSLHCFDLTVLDVSGQHNIRFRDCFCDDRERWKLLLECQIFPATETDPRTV